MSDRNKNWWLIGRDPPPDLIKDERGNREEREAYLTKFIADSEECEQLHREAATITTTNEDGDLVTFERFGVHEIVRGFALIDSGLYLGMWPSMVDSVNVLRYHKFERDRRDEDGRCHGGCNSASQCNTDSGEVICRRTNLPCVEQELIEPLLIAYLIYRIAGEPSIRANGRD